MTTETRVEVLEVIVSCLKRGMEPRDCLELCIKKYPDTDLKELVKEVCNVYGVDVQPF